MPFPLAHPAAVLPLRRFCPQGLNFPALVIGSLVPDIAYGFDVILNSQFHIAGRFQWLGYSHLAQLSHDSIVGAFGFDLPVGFVMWLLFLGLRLPIIALLPGRFQSVLRPMCRWPAIFSWGVVASLLIGTWTHLLLDSVAHGDGWIALHVPLLQHRYRWDRLRSMQLCDILYYAFTFCGSGWLAVCYLNWLDSTGLTKSPGNPLKTWVFATLFATGTVVIADACRDGHDMSLGRAGLASIALVLAFVAASVIHIPTHTQETSNR